MIKDYSIGQSINNVILYCTDKTSGISSRGDNYLSLTLRDSSGTINGKVWEINDNIDDFEAKDFISINGTVTTFKDALQLNITHIAKIDPSKVKMDDFCPKTPQDMDQMFNKLMSIINSISNTYLKTLLTNLFTNEKFIAKFKVNSAAKAVHHAYIGGLLEHTLAVTNICNYLITQYPTLNRDLLLTAAICHDIGKIKEISAFPENDYTDDGNLLGHIYMGTEMIDTQAKKIEGFPKQLLNELKHCILAHHGKLEFGSPKTPSLIEAVALSYADDMDAKLRRFSDLLNETESDNWSDKNDFFLNSKYRKTIV